MKQRRHYTSHRLSRDAERLVWKARGLADSGSRAEDAWWETELAEQIGKMLEDGQEEALNQALDRLHETHARAYDELADLVEAGVECNVIEGPDGPMRTLLLTAPILAWSRYSIPARTLPPQAFWPAPKIDSALVRVMRENRLGETERIRAFGGVVHNGFSFRRQTFRKGLSPAVDPLRGRSGVRAAPRWRPARFWQW